MIVVRTDSGISIEIESGLNGDWIIYGIHENSATGRNKILLFIILGFFLFLLLVSRPSQSCVRSYRINNNKQETFF